jgi:dynein intermediate chain
MDDETRTARQKAIAEKKRRLEEIKARRNAAVPASAAPASGGNLDEYIDELLKSSTPAVAPVEEKIEETIAFAKPAPAASNDALVVVETAAPAAAEPQVVVVAAPQVEKFEVAIQCEEDDFPPPSLVDEDEPLKDDESDTEDVNQSAIERSISRDLEAHPEIAEPLTQEERAKLISTSNFTHFISTASKRVERLLGASTAEEGMFGSLANGWAGLDFVEDYDNENEDTKGKKKKMEQHPYQSGGFFTAKATYEFTDWTKGRNITDIEWCPSHPEWVLTSYNSCSGERKLGMGSNNPSTRHLSPHDPSSSFLSSSASSIPNEGIVAIYNLILPTRPEHIFCAGCPIVRTKFHPSEHPKLVLGGGISGQLLVWDARVGRYPVQRSGSGHDVDLVGMDVLADEDAGSKLVTASSDGKINYWSLSNMREPLESFKVDANLSCIDVLHGSNNEGIVCGDERGGLHAVYSASASAGAGSSSLKRVVRTLHTGGGGADVADAFEEDSNAMDTNADEIGIGHFGMVTSVAARPFINNSNTHRSSTSGGTFKGFLQGAAGLVVTTGVDWSTKLWAPAYTDKPLMSFLSNSYDYMCDAQW